MFILKEWYILIGGLLMEVNRNEQKLVKDYKTVNVKLFTYIYHNNKIKTNQILLMFSFLF